MKAILTIALFVLAAGSLGWALVAAFSLLRWLVRGRPMTPIRKGKPGLPDDPEPGFLFRIIQILILVGFGFICLAASGGPPAGINPFEQPNTPPSTSP